MEVFLYLQKGEGFSFALNGVTDQEFSISYVEERGEDKYYAGIVIEVVTNGGKNIVHEERNDADIPNSISKKDE